MGNGLRLVTERQPSGGPAAVALLVAVGSRHELLPEDWGAAHFLEHALFKGAGEYDGPALAAAIDDLGGEVNAYTTRDYTCFYAKVLPEYLDAAFDLLYTLVTAPRLEDSDIAKEREVIAEELLEAEDDLEDRCDNAFLEALYPVPTFTHEILGTVESVRGWTRPRLVAFHRRWYRPERTVVAIAGEGAFAQVERLVRRFGLGDRAWPLCPPPLPVAPRERLVRLDRDQVHWMVGVSTGPTRDWKRALAFEVAAALIAGQNSSRLWQRLREEHGLAYTVQSGASLHADRGEMSLYAVVSPSKLEDALRLTAQELLALARGEVQAEAVQRAKVQLEAAVRFQWETSDGRMLHLGRYVLEGQRPPTLEELVHRIRTLSREEVATCLAEAWGDPQRWALAAVGPLPRRWSSVKARVLASLI